MQAISLPCPNGCERTVAAHGKDIHYCVIHEFGEVYREYLGCYDGEIITRAGNNSDAENNLNDYVLLLCEQGLDPADGVPGIDDNAPGSPPDPDPAPGHCLNCEGAHHIQRCPEIWQALRAPAPARRTLVAAVRTTARALLGRQGGDGLAPSGEEYQHSTALHS